MPLDQAGPEIRWALANLQGLQTGNVRRFVRSLDDAMNNTSLILLFEVGDRALLFGGDAQWESWAFALSRRGISSRLANVVLYKVGHHGSGNATPRKLWGMLKKRSAQQTPDRLIAMLPTTIGPYGGVPASELVEALGRETDLLRSDKTPAAAKGVLSCTLKVGATDTSGRTS